MLSPAKCIGSAVDRPAVIVRLRGRDDQVAFAHVRAAGDGGDDRQVTQMECRVARRRRSRLHADSVNFSTSIGQPDDLAAVAHLMVVDRQNIRQARVGICMPIRLFEDDLIEAVVVVDDGDDAVGLVGVAAAEREDVQVLAPPASSMSIVRSGGSEIRILSAPVPRIEMRHQWSARRAAPHWRVLTDMLVAEIFTVRLSATALRSRMVSPSVSRKRSAPKPVAKIVGVRPGHAGQGVRAGAAVELVVAVAAASCGRRPRRR